jgi:hypothetical protein
MATVDAAGLAATRAVEAATRRATGWAITRRIISLVSFEGLKDGDLDVTGVSREWSAESKRKQALKIDGDSNPRKNFVRNDAPLLEVKLISTAAE